MEIKTYNKQQLYDLITSEAFKTMPAIPISTHRAISHIHNPRAAKEDTMMIIAWEKDQMAGYLGVLPDRIYTVDGRALKCGWLNCIWVDPALRIKGLTGRMMAAAFAAWDSRLLVTNFSPEAAGLYNRSGRFNDLRINDGLRCFLRFNLHEVLPKKNEKYKPYTSILKFGDTLANIVIATRLFFYKPKISDCISFEQVREVDHDLNQYILSKQAASLERRSADELNWILDYPWLKESKPTAESRRYYFSSVCDRFSNLCFRLVNKGEIKGFLHFTIRDNHINIPYTYFEPEYLPDVVQYIYKIMLDYKLNMLTVFHPSLVKFFRSHMTPFIYKRDIKRQYIISKALDAHFADRDTLQIQDGDVDYAFT